MRPSTRLLAVVCKNSPTPKNAGQYLIARNPTGLTGVLTHPYPRPALIHLYSATLSKLAAFPAHSVYRQSVEALTKHRLSIIAKTLPPGYPEWQTRLRAQLAAHPEIVSEASSYTAFDGETYVVPAEEDSSDDREEEWDGDDTIEERGEGPRSAESRLKQAKELGEGHQLQTSQSPTHIVMNEPPLTADQISDIETEIAAGLIEEVIAVAEAELDLVEKMYEAKVWEELAEKPVEGQWDYHQRDRNVGITQAP